MYRKYDDKTLEKLWNELSDIPTIIDEDYYTCIDEDWQGWSKGTDIEEIWYWFDERHSKGVHYLLYEYKG